MCSGRAHDAARPQRCWPRPCVAYRLGRRPPKVWSLVTTTAVSAGAVGRRRHEARVEVLLAVGACGVLATVLTAWAVSRSPTLVDPQGTAIWRSLLVASYVTVGLYTWWRRPGN